MITVIFKLACIVTLAFMLVAALSSAGTCLGENVWVWLSCGLLAGFFALFIAPWVDAQVTAAKNAPAP